MRAHCLSQTKVAITIEQVLRFFVRLFVVYLTVRNQFFQIMASMIRNQLANYMQSLIKPSDYEWILPKYNRPKLDTLAASGQFPHVGGLADALFYAAVFGVLRMILTYFAMKPFAIASMKITFKAQKRIPSVDAFIARNGPITSIKVRVGVEIRKMSRVQFPILSHNLSSVF
jgi:hypothetical protein